MEARCEEASRRLPAGVNKTRALTRPRRAGWPRLGVRGRVKVGLGGVGWGWVGFGRSVTAHRSHRVQKITSPVLDGNSTTNV